MKSGFYSARQVRADDEDENDGAFGVAILVHLKDGHFVGVDQGGCKLTGLYQTLTNGGTRFQLSYAFKAGMPLPNGTILEEAMTIESEIEVDADAGDGEPQPIDFGFGPMLIALEWLAAPA
jgi:hypothetical protein